MSCEHNTVSRCHQCCSPLIVQVPGLQGTGIVWENCSEAEKKDITDTILTPVKEQASIVESTSKEIKEWLAKTEQLFDDAQTVSGASCYEEFITVSSAIAANTAITIPNSHKYVVGKHHLKVGYNGYILSRGQGFNEIGTSGDFSTTFSLTFDAKATDQITVWVEALSKEVVDEAVYEQVELAKGYAEESSKAASTVSTVIPYLGDIQSVNSIAEQTRTVSDNISSVIKAGNLYNHAGDISALSEHINDLHKVGQDLLVTDELDLSYDLGLITDDVEPTGTVTGGILKSVADHLDDCIHPVGQNIDAVHALANNISTVSKAAILTGHIDDISALSAHVDDLHKVGQDLLVTEIEDFSYDLGSVSDKADTGTTVTGGILKKVADHIDDCIHPVSENIDKVQNVADNLSTVNRSAGLMDHVADIAALSSHLDDLHKVGQDLLVTDATDTSFDYGSVSDNVDPVSTVTGGILKEVADHIEDCIHPVSEHLAEIHNVQSNIEEIKATNLHLDEIHVVGQDLQGIESSSLDFGAVTEGVDSITTVTDGYIKKVAEHIDDCIHPVGENIEKIEVVASNLNPINSVSEMLAIDYEKIFNEGIS